MAVEEIIEAMPIPDEIKRKALMLVSVGINPTHYLITAISRHEAKELERQHPKPQLPSDYTEIEREIHEMLIENTGAHILDSGGIYGRHWQLNRSVADFRQTPRVKVTVWDDGQVDFSINVFHYLTAYLEKDDIAKMLEVGLYAYAEKSPSDYSWLWIMEEYAESISDLFQFVSKPINTYNYENLLSQVLQFVLMEGEDDAYIILQVHGGCDVRGGYTKPRVFHVIDSEYFWMAQTWIFASCQCTAIDSPECGFYWNGEDGTPTDFPTYWKPMPKHENAKSWEYQLICSKCSEPVSFDAYLDY